MAIIKSLNGTAVSVIVSCVLILVAFIFGMKVAGVSEEEIEAVRSEIAGVSEKLAQIEDNKKQIEDNKKQILENQKSASSNSRDLADIKRTVGSVNTTLSRDISVIKSGSGGMAQQLENFNKTLGLKWIRRPGDTHSYCLTPYPLPWHLAQDFASKLGGNLAVIDDEAENKWLAVTFPAKTEYWIGATDEKQEGKWKWVNGNEVKFTNWAQGEPDNYKNSQHYVIFNKQGTGARGQWNDVVGNEVRIGIIELGD